MNQETRMIRLVGCGILRKETDFLISKNGWQVDAHYLQSSLHNYLARLKTTLVDVLNKNDKENRETVVFYGACHPQMDTLLQERRLHRTEGQNCIVMLLGYERFMDELSHGAYFLLEDWALTWEPLLTGIFGNNIMVIREIFHSSHKYILAIRTPCSSDFTEAAEAAARFVDLPLSWTETGLDHLESVLSTALGKN
ncbi:MAG: DUF1638 domain-containing protein [Magnetococcales bacterium]|nr:DUF1638 domain-containing protein [Magnetococcales bacterium]